MSIVAVVLKTVEKIGVLNGITDKLYEKNYNIIYTHLFVENNQGRIYMELMGVDDFDKLLEDISNTPNVISVEPSATLDKIYGKRVIIVGDGKLMADALRGGIMEAQMHNTHGETISVDGMIIGGGSQIQEAVTSMDKLPRIHALVLSGSMMGGLITEEIIKLKKENPSIKVIALEMLGDLDNVVDLVINDPVQAGIMAVKLVSENVSYDDDIKDNTFLEKE